MLRSLRSRLWFSYAVLIALVLCVVGAAIVLVVVRSNIPLQQAALSLQRLRLNALPKLRIVAGYSPQVLQQMLTKNASQIEGRIVVLDLDGNVLADSMAPQGASLPDFEGQPALTAVGDLPKTYRDQEGHSWYYSIDVIKAESRVFFAVHRPRLQIVTIFRDSFLRPLVIAGLIALFFAFILSLLMARWVSAPLKQISEEAQQVAAGEAHPIPLTGPSEVQKLLRAFNQMSSQVQQSQQSQQDFVANVSHELKTPLTAIQGFAKAILDGTAASPKALINAASVIDDEASRMHRLVLDLLTLARMDSGTAAFAKVSVNMNDLLEAVGIKFGPIAKNAGVVLDVQPGGLADPVIGDPDRLIQVLNNLVDNAIKFTPAGGKVTVFSEVVDQQVLIHVADTGQGISPAEQKRIFERFYQVDKARPGGAVRGVGLGLSISQQIVEAHGGKIVLTSTPGEGSHFVVKLPIQD